LRYLDTGEFRSGRIAADGIDVPAKGKRVRSR
jgi:hypothetical protein